MIQSIPQIRFPEQLCIGSHPAKMICINSNCKNNVFICVNETCQTCENNHRSCSTYWLNALNDRIQKKRQNISSSIDQAMHQLLKIYDQAIEKIKAQKQKVSEQKQFYGLAQKQAQFVKLILQGQGNTINAELVSEVMKSLPKEQKFCTDVFTLQRAWKKKQQQLQLLLAYLKKIQFKRPTSIESQIIDNTKTIQSFFDRPIISYELLYRASENQFSAFNFHQKCDGKKNTLVIAKTQFGKIIGAFTPLPWSSNGAYGTDSGSESQLRTFLFSITEKVKFPLKTTNAQYATYNNSGYGPTFGGGHDLYIANASDVTNTSYTNFGHSYETGTKPPNNQQAYEYLTGATSGYNIRFTEWEVFELDL